LYCLTGSWVFSNQQVFQNVVVPIQTVDGIIEADHRPYDLISQINPGTPLTIMFFVFILEYIYRLVLRSRQRKINKKNSIHDKDLSHLFWDVITPVQKNKWLMEELCCQLRLGIKTIPDETLQKLGVNSLTHEPNINYMVSRYAYDMLASVRY